MAVLNLTKNTTVEALRKEFFNAFGAQIKLYKGNKKAEMEDTLGDLGLTAEGEFECRSNLTVGSFIRRMAKNHGLRVRVYTSDEWVAVLDGLTIESAGKVKKNAVKADMESMIAYKHKTDTANSDEDEDEDVDVDEDVDDDEEFDDDDDGFCDNVEYNGIEYTCCDGSAEASMFVDDELEDAESIVIPQTVVDNENGNKYTVTGYVITAGAYSKITFPPTLEYIQGETFSDMDEDELSELHHNLAENKNFVIKDRLIYKYEDFDDDKHVYKLVNVQLNRPEGSFNIPEGVGALARSIFINCDKLTEVIIPSSMRYIDFEPFEGCNSLKRVVVYAPKSQIKCFDDCGDEISKIEDIIPAGVTLSFVEPKAGTHQHIKESFDRVSASTKKSFERQKELLSNTKAEMKKSMLGEQSANKTTKKGCMPIILFIAIFTSIIAFLL